MIIYFWNNTDKNGANPKTSAIKYREPLNVSKTTWG